MGTMTMSAPPTTRITPAEPLSREPDGRCFACKCVAWRGLVTPGGGEVCGVCHPDPLALRAAWLARKGRVAERGGTA